MKAFQWAICAATVSCMSMCMTLVYNGTASAGSMAWRSRCPTSTCHKVRTPWQSCASAWSCYQNGFAAVSESKARGRFYAFRSCILTYRAHRGC
ncbi:hypothetical protein BC834DRAFT_536469 [Gloeopeniophorella convolvens]|nr:hypothetical protein BC834DRAFT_536469 [Gloeopeniophorella convolvens]